MSLHRGLKAHSIVEASLDVAGAVRRCTVVLRNAQRDGLEATLEVRTNRRDKDTEGVLRSGSNTNNLAGANHKRTHVERGARAKGRNPSSVSSNNLLNSLNKTILRERRHLEALSGVIHALGVHVRAEADDAAVLGGVSLEALKDLLAVVEDATALRNVHGVVGGQATLVPLAILPVSLVAIVGLHVAKAQATPVQILLLNGHDCSLHYENRKRAYAGRTCLQHMCGVPKAARM